MQAYAASAIDAAAQEDQVLALAASALASYTDAFNLDPAGNTRKIAALRARASATGHE